jgi:hypothetical protein
MRISDDLESQLDQEQRDEERALALEEERLRLGRLTLRDRLIAMSGDCGDGPGRASGSSSVALGNSTSGRSRSAATG